MSIRFPVVSQKLDLGVGMDLPWGSATGFESSSLNGTVGPTPKVRRFIENSIQDFTHFFFSFQPRGRNAIRSEDYFPAYDELIAALEKNRGSHPLTFSLHQTMLNLGSLGRYDREPILKFTNECVERYSLKWINEDVGIWSLKGKSLPYPLPPLMTESGLKGCIESVNECQSALKVPLCIEFPGFTEGASFTLGDFEAYDYFKILAEETHSPVTLDTGHLLGYQWLKGKRGTDLYSDLETLPLEHCFEIHLSGCQIVENRFMDYHHGILLDEQLDLLELLIAKCPNLKAITYEDPRFNEEGLLIPKSLPNYQKLKEMVRLWKQPIAVV